MYATVELAERMGNGGGVDEAEAGAHQTSPDADTPETPARRCVIA